MASKCDGLEVVKALSGSVESIQHFMKEAHDLEGAEGYVIRFDDGHMVKLKGYGILIFIRH